LLGQENSKTEVHVANSLAIPSSTDPNASQKNKKPSGGTLRNIGALAKLLSSDTVSRQAQHGTTTLVRAHHANGPNPSGVGQNNTRSNSNKPKEAIGAAEGQANDLDSENVLYDEDFEIEEEKINF